VSRKTTLVALAVLAGLAALLLLATSGPFGRRSPPVPVEAVRRGRFVLRVPAEGNLEAVRATPITVPVGVPGPFRIGWLAEDGSRVQAGEVVVRFDPSEIEKALLDASDALRTARLKTDKERAEGSAAIRKLEGDLELARLELKDARQFQKKDAMIFSRNDIVESDLDEQLAHEREEHAQGVRHTRERLSGTEIELLGIDIRQADLRIQRARQSLAALSVTAPHDGVFVLHRNGRGDPVRVGDSVWNGQALAEIPDLSNMRAVVYVLEADAGGLAPGKPATVTVESRPGVAVPATIARVDSLAKPQRRGSPVQYFAVSLDLARTDPATMKPGQRVQAELLLDDRADALTVPRQAVFERDGRNVVYRRKRRQGDPFEPVEVTLGPSGMGRVVIEKGLAAGDVVALADPARPEEQETPDAATPPAPGPVGGDRGDDE
jgi:multidrug efflux pump subunit AcrA (membrane-fusion protein)